MLNELTALTMILHLRQNNHLLSELSSKVSALRGVTVNIYDNARDQNVLDNTVRFSPSPLSLLRCCSWAA